MPNINMTTRLGDLIAKNSVGLPTNPTEMLVCAITNLTNIKYAQIERKSKLNPAELTRVIVEANQAMCMTTDVGVQNCIRLLATDVFQGSMAMAIIAEQTENYMAALRIRKQMIIDGESTETMEDFEKKFGIID